MHDKIKEIVENAQRIVVVQADNPDADSLGSALALEHIFSDLGKDVALYCGVNIPEYLRYMSGWDRVINELPSRFDLSVIVDASTYTLLEKLEVSGKLKLLKTKPCVVLDHHATVERPIDFTNYQLIRTDVASTGELIYHLSHDNGWKISSEAAEHLMTSILGDTQGLMNDLTTADTYRVMADLTDLGANRPMLEESRREYGKMPEKIYRYKAALINNTEFSNCGRVAHVAIPQDELYEYSPLYNPVPLIQFDILQVKGVALSIVFKVYDDGKVTGALRSNHSYPICGKLAEALGGGGHDYASGFKITDGRTFEEIKEKCLDKAASLIEELELGDKDETLQHTY